MKTSRTIFDSSSCYTTLAWPGCAGGWPGFVAPTMGRLVSPVSTAQAARSQELTSSSYFGVQTAVTAAIIRAGHKHSRVRPLLVLSNLSLTAGFSYNWQEHCSVFRDWDIKTTVGGETLLQSTGNNRVSIVYVLSCSKLELFVFIVSQPISSLLSCIRFLFGDNWQHCPVGEQEQQLAGQIIQWQHCCYY